MSQFLEPFLNFFLTNDGNYKIYIIAISFLLLLILKNSLTKFYLNFVFKIFRIEESRLNQNLHRIINFQIKTFILFILFIFSLILANFNSYLNLILQNIFKSFCIVIIFIIYFSIKQSLKNFISQF